MTAPSRARYTRGAQRRAELVKAAADVLLEGGLGAVTARAVATRAGLPLASTTYYFASVDDLRDEALRHVTDSWVAQAAAVVAALPERLDRSQVARAVIGIVGGDARREQVLLVYERYLEAGRHERLRPLVAESNKRLVEFVLEVLRRADLPADEADARVVLAVADGTTIMALAEGQPTPAATAAALEHVLSGGGPPTSRCGT